VVRWDQNVSAGDWLGGCGLDSTGSGQGQVAGCCECGDEPSSSCATELVSYTVHSISSELLTDFLNKQYFGCSYMFVSLSVRKPVLFYIGFSLRDYGLGDRGSIPGRGERILPLSSVSRPALGPTQPPVQWVPGVRSPGVKRGRGVKLTTHPHLVPRSRMSRSYISSPSKRLRGV
jgi:hypothetical protein